MRRTAETDLHRPDTPTTGAAERAGDPALLALAQAARVQTTYKDGTGTWRTASADALRRVLHALGLPAADGQTARDSLARLRAARVAPGLTDVVTVWDGGPARVQIRVPVDLADRPLGLRVLFEDGGERGWTHTPDGPGAILHAEGQRSVAHLVALPGDLPIGYHTLEVRFGEDIHRAHLLVAPSEAPRAEEPEWGLFVPTYALHHKDDHGVGDLGSLQRLAAWVGVRGGTTIATLPLLDTFLGGPIHDPSPYAPVSRRFWSGLLIDPTQEPEYRHPEVRRVHEDAAFRERLDRLRQGRFVDHAAVWAAKSELLQAMADVLDAEDTGRRRSFRRWVRHHPDVVRYARFRAATQAHGPWHGWPQSAREGDLSGLEIDDAIVRLHTYIQWVTDEQVARIEASAEHPLRLHLDLPLGAHADGYDTWNDRAAYAPGVEVGAPPDGFFEKGQKWGFQPLNPRRLRQSGYRHFAACLRHHLRHATVLRIDHVMALHRLFWVPNDLEATEGAYVHYPAEELYAVVLIEAHRAGALIVGEDLGTVPEAVHEAMDRHHLHRTYVFQLQARTDDGRPPTPGRNSLATLNTHDMVPFAAWWNAHDVTQRVDRGFLDEQAAAAARAKREVLKARVLKGLRNRSVGNEKASPGTRPRADGDDDRPADASHRSAGPPGDESSPPSSPDAPDRGASDVAPSSRNKDAPHASPAPGIELAAARDIALRFLFRSPAALVVLNLEDLWFETEPQNQPGYGPDSPEGRRNWARRTRYTLDEIMDDPEVTRVLAELAPTRRSDAGRKGDA